MTTSESTFESVFITLERIPPDREAKIERVILTFGSKAAGELGSAPAKCRLFISMERVRNDESSLSETTNLRANQHRAIHKQPHVCSYPMVDLSRDDSVTGETRLRTLPPTDASD